MSAKFFLAIALIVALGGPCLAQAGSSSSPTREVPGWRPATPATADPASGSSAVLPASAIMPAGPASAASAAPAAPRRAGAQVTSGNGTLPNEAGQIWREYDISPYTSNVTATDHAEQAVVDWILRETGYEAWHSEPLGVLSATRKTLRVYHTPQMQAVVAELVDRFVSSEAKTYNFGIRVITLDQPNWRLRAHRVLKPVAVQTPGANAWLMEKEDAALLMAEFQRRADFREHNSSQMLVNNGQTARVPATRPRTYVRDIILRPDIFPGYEAQNGQVEEGFSLEFSPLLSLDRRMIDATIKCDIDQVEKMIPVSMEVPSPGAPRQRLKIDVPQMSHFRFHERFRWPTEQVLLIGMGMVALPVPSEGKPLIAGIPLPIGSTPARGDLLLWVECKGQLAEPSRFTPGASRETAVPRARLH